MKKLIKRFREWRDRRFRERIDRVYFRHDGTGNRFVDGILWTVKDSKTGQIGDSASCFNSLSSHDIDLLGSRSLADALPVDHPARRVLELASHAARQACGKAYFDHSSKAKRIG